MTVIDDIWESMNSQAPTSGASTLSGLQRKSPGKVGSFKRFDSSMSWMTEWTRNSVENSVVNDVQPCPNLEAIEHVEKTVIVPSIPEGVLQSRESVLLYLNRHLAILDSQHTSPSDKTLSMQILQQAITKSPPSLLTPIFESFAKPLTRLLSAQADKLRESAASALGSLLPHAADSELFASLPFIFSALIARLGSGEEEGASLPEAMRPVPEQKPTEIATPIESCEEVRLALSSVIRVLLHRLAAKPQLQAAWVNESVGLIRVVAMDPCPAVKIDGCEVMEIFCSTNRSILLHFSTSLARSLTSCLSHAHAKLRIAGLRAVTACMKCATWKYTFDIVAMMSGWQDPNLVPVKAFYELTTKVNYMSLFTFDRHPAVRLFWFETVAYWLLTCEDRVDFEQQVFPHLLSGLFDEDRDIAKTVWLILQQKLGPAYEKEKEAELRDIKQSGRDYAWTYGRQVGVKSPGEISALVDRGMSADKDVGYASLAPMESRARAYAWSEISPRPGAITRPNLGMRSWGRAMSRRFILALFDKTTDFRDCTATNAAKLLRILVGLAEDGITEWLSQILTGALKVLQSVDNRGIRNPFVPQVAVDSYDVLPCDLSEIHLQILRLVGAYVDPRAWMEICTGNFTIWSPVLVELIRGAIFVVPEDLPGLGRLQKVRDEILRGLLESKNVSEICTGSVANRDDFIRLLLLVSENKRFQLSEEDCICIVRLAVSLGESEIVARICAVWSLSGSKVKNEILKRMLSDPFPFEGVDTVARVVQILGGELSNDLSEKLESWLSASQSATDTGRIVKLVVYLARQQISSGPRYCKILSTILSTPSLKPKDILSSLNELRSLTIHNSPHLISSLINIIGNRKMDKDIKELAIQKEIERSGLKTASDLVFAKQKTIREEAETLADHIRALAAQLVAAWSKTEQGRIALIQFKDSLLDAVWSECKGSRPSPIVVQIFVAYAMANIYGSTQNGDLTLREEAPSLSALVKPTRSSIDAVACDSDVAPVVLTPLQRVSLLIEACVGLNVSFPPEINSPHVPLDSPAESLLNLQDSRVIGNVFGQPEKSLRWNAAWRLSICLVEVTARHPAEVATLAMRWESKRQPNRVSLCKFALLKAGV